jgi:hypothetical protein
MGRLEVTTAASGDVKRQALVFFLTLSLDKSLSIVDVVCMGYYRLVLVPFRTLV